MRARRSCLALAALLLGAAAGCSYRSSLSLPAPYESIGIELFSNSSLEPDLEVELHRALVRNARELLDGPVVAPGRARLLLRGEVLEYRRRSGIRSRENVQLETGLTVRARAFLVDARDERVVAAPVTVSTQIGYALDRRTVNEAEARRRVLGNLAQRIVLELVARSEAAQDSDAASAPGATFEERE